LTKILVPCRFVATKLSIKNFIFYFTKHLVVLTINWNFFFLLTFIFKAKTLPISMLPQGWNSILDFIVWRMFWKGGKKQKRKRKRKRSFFLSPFISHHGFSLPNNNCFTSCFIVGRVRESFQNTPYQQMLRET